MPPPTWNSAERLMTPPSISAAFAVVPPMSKVTRSSWPMSPAMASAPTTPPAGPDSTMLTGRRAASSAEVSPPFDCMMSRWALGQRSRIACRSRSR